MSPEVGTSGRVVGEGHPTGVGTPVHYLSLGLMWRERGGQEGCPGSPGSITNGPQISKEPNLRNRINDLFGGNRGVLRFGLSKGS